LGITFGGSKDYWPEATGTLIQKDAGLETSDILVADSEWFSNEEALPRGFLRPKSWQRTLWFDHSDGIFFEGAFSGRPRDWSKRTWVSRVDHVFRSHFVEGWTYPKNVVPSAFGLTERIIAALDHPLPFEQRESGILFNSRVLHTCRRVFRESWSLERAGLPFLERFSSGSPGNGLDEIWYQATGGRHHRDYYRILGSVTHCSAIGGYFGPSRGNVRSAQFHQRAKHFDRQGMPGDRVYQFDSWRLWESLLAGCLTILPHLDKYGCRLPIVPTHGQEYFGFDFSHPEASWEELRSLRGAWEEIGARGRRWALEHYSPEATARRTLEALNAGR
jgi:hypothetical protein